jgi:hypothetical protein
MSGTMTRTRSSGSPYTAHSASRVGWAPWQADHTVNLSPSQRAAPERGSSGTALMRVFSMRSSTSTSAPLKSASVLDFIVASVLVPCAGNSSTSSRAASSGSMTTGSGS